MTISAPNRTPDNNWANYTFNFRVFKDKDDFIKQVTDKNQSENSSFRSASKFTEQFVSNKYQNALTYEYTAQLEDYIGKFDEIFDNIDMGGAFKKKKLLITDDKRGIFSFGVASKGLYRGFEYYSEEIAQDKPDELQKYNKFPGVVPSNLVENLVMVGEKQFWYTSSSTNKMYQLTRQQEGTAEMLSKNPNAKILETEGGMKYADPSSYDGFNLKFKTSTKKSYLMFDKKGGKAEMVELYIPIHWSYKLKNALPVFMVAKYLQTVGIKVRISAIRMYHETFTYFYMWSIPIKDYGEEMDFNKMALVGVDSRWWYLMQAGVRSLSPVRTFNRGSRTQYVTVDGSGGEAGNIADYVEAFARYRNWYEEQIKLGLLEPLRVDKKLIMIGGIMEDIDNWTEEFLLEKTYEEFYRIMDRIDFSFNKPELVVQRIYRRMVDEKLEKYFTELSTSNPPISSNDIQNLMDIQKQRLVSDLKRYVQQVLSDTYTYPIGGQYPESQESADEMEEEFDTKLEALNTYLKSL